VLKLLLEKKLGAQAHRVSIISASGNQNFSPFLRMIRAWASAKIPHLVVTDFDSLVKATDRAILVGSKTAGYALTGEPAFHAKVDSALDKGEAEFTNVATEATTFLKAAGLNVFVFSSDLENSLITDVNKQEAAEILTKVATNGVDYKSGYNLNALKRLIGSKGITLTPPDNAPFKKPFIHRKIADSIELTNCHPDITRLLTAIESL
jgi:putative ATP-dependent endonuclease of the OLD family